MTQMTGRVSDVEGQVQKMSRQMAEMDSRFNQTTAKADQALENLQRLKLDRRLVLDLKQGAFFALNSTVLTSQAKKEIDSFVSDLKGDANGSSLLFVVAGHTDDIGHQRSNYELARLRADNVASYLMTVKNINPGRLAIISYGETAPIADNATEAGRAKNRRVEILVYTDSVSIGSAQQAIPGR
ncbi:MAG: OmpA family protein [Candidatus Binatia bacterium]